MARSKSLPRVYVPDPIPVHGIFDAPADAAHHLAHVLRLAEGDVLAVFDGRGLEYPATIERVGKSAVTLRVGEPHEVDRESPLRVTLAQGISSGERMDYTVQKAVELGVAAIQPLSTERSVVRLSSERAAKRVAHWQAIAVAACEQCGRNRIPPIAPLQSLLDWLHANRHRKVAIAAPGAASSLRAFVGDAPPAAIVIGPEGGFTEAERAEAGAAGAVAVSLGPRVLRAETAGPAALAMLAALAGDAR